MIRYDLAGRTAVITGASGGLGTALARALRAKGANIALVDLDAERVEVQAEQLGDARTARGRAADIRDLEGLTDVMSSVRDPAGTESSFALKPLGIKKLDSIAELWWTQHQLQRIGAGKDPDPRYGTRRAVLSALRRDGINNFRRRRA